MIRVLFVSGGVLNHGGITTHMMNYYRNFDCNKVQIDFAVHGGKGVFDEEIKSRGGKVFYVPAKKENPVKNYTELIKIFKQYSIVHCHMDGMNGMVLGMAKKAGVPIRISHSHNTEHLTCNQLKLAIHEHYKRMIPKTATHLWCCSSEAGRWLYGSRKFRVIPNAFDIRKYRFCQDKRDRLRSAYSCEDKYVIGHVGRLDYQKNQEYLLRIFREAIRGGVTKKKLQLVLVGDGPDRIRIEQKMKAMGIENQVIMTGDVDNVHEYLNMFDVFVLPSRFEGLPISALEAQANGLTCICSENVPIVNITGGMDVTDLNKPELWVKKIISGYQRNEDYYYKLLETDFNIEKSAVKLQRIYERMGGCTR